MTGQFSTHASPEEPLNLVFELRAGARPGTESGPSLSDALFRIQARNAVVGALVFQIWCATLFATQDVIQAAIPDGISRGAVYLLSLAIPVTAIFPVQKFFHGFVNSVRRDRRT